MGVRRLHSLRGRRETHLEAALTEKLVPRPEGYLDHGTKLRHLPGDVVLDVGQALGPWGSDAPRARTGSDTHLEVGDELLDNDLPCCETLDEDVRGTKVVWCNVLFDQRLLSRDS